MKLLFVGRMIDRKFMSKVLPLVENERVDQIYVVRREFIEYDKLVCYSPPRWIKPILPLAELYNLVCIFYIALRYKPVVLIASGMIMHGIYVNLAGKILGKPTISLLMGNNDLLINYPQPKWLKRILLMITSWADHIGTRGTRSKAWLIEQGIKAEKIFINPNVFDFEEFKPITVKKAYDLVYVGLLKEYKRVDLLIDIVEILVKRYGHSDVQLAIAGDGPLRQGLEEKIKEKKLEENIFFKGKMDKHDLNLLINTSKIFVMTSVGEGLPMAMVEAMSCGLPAVAFDDADIGDIIQHQVNGFLCPILDTEQFAGHLHQLISNPPLLAKMSEQALAIREIMQEEYSLPYVKNVWEKVLDKFDPNSSVVRTRV